jgi:hypothetical protein
MEEMHKQEITKEDGRYLIFFTFDDEDPGLTESDHNDEPASAKRQEHPMTHDA